MSTAGQLVDQARRLLLGTTIEQVNELGATIDDNDEPISFSYDLGGIQPGADIEIDTELIHVWTVNAGAKQASDVRRGHQGTTAASHTLGALVRVNPRWSSQHLFELLQMEVRALAGHGLHRFRTANLTVYNYEHESWDVSAVTDMAEPYLVDGRPDTWAFYDRSNNLLKGEWRRQPCVLTYVARVAAPTALTDNLSTLGVESSWEDILVLGMKIRAASARETARNDFIAQGEPRRADEVPPGAMAGSIRADAALYRQRVGDEVAALRRKYPRYLRRSSGETVPLND